MHLGPIIDRIEKLASGRPFGQLPQLRKGLKPTAQAHRHIFYFVRSLDASRTEWDYAFHCGGRRELQFNVGLEDARRTLRYGVAFSFQGSRNLTDLGVLRRSVGRFNLFVRKNPAYLSRFSMWTHESGRDRSERGTVRPIGNELFRWGVFVFVGSVQPAKMRSIDYERILDDLDWLMPLYEYVEGKGRELPVKQLQSGFQFRPGCSIGALSAKAVLPEREVKIELRQKKIQIALHSYLAVQFGKENVSVEQRIPNRSVDLAVLQGHELWYYEVKIAPSVKQSIREALGQLLEYSYWPGMKEANRLIVVGEEAPSAESRRYVSLLRKRFKIPVEYQRFNLSTGKLMPA